MFQQNHVSTAITATKHFHHTWERLPSLLHQYTGLPAHIRRLRCVCPLQATYRPCAWKSGERL